MRIGPMGDEVRPRQGGGNPFSGAPARSTPREPGPVLPGPSWWRVVVLMAGVGVMALVVERTWSWRIGMEQRPCGCACHGR